MHDWAYCELADLDAAEYYQNSSGLWTRGLLIRRHIADREQANDAPDLCDPPLIRWSIQEIRRIATRLAQQRIAKSHVIAWSLWRRAHQAAAKRAHLRLKQKMQL